jgi:hypothetical protein
VDQVAEGLSYEVAFLCFVPGEGSFLFEQCTFLPCLQIRSRIERGYSILAFSPL